jgi:hypothetical protein
VARARRGKLEVPAGRIGLLGVRRPESFRRSVELRDRVIAQAAVDGSPKAPGDGAEPSEQASQTTCSVLHPARAPCPATLELTLVADDGEPTATPLGVLTPFLVDEASDLDGDEHDPDLLPVERAGKPLDTSDRRWQRRQDLSCISWSSGGLAESGH